MKRSHLKTTKNSALFCPPSLFIQRTLGLIFALLECNSPHILIVLRHYLRHYLGLTRPHHKVLHFLIGSSCSPVSTRATALPAFYFLAAANCLVLPIISAIELSDLLWLSVTFCHSCHSYHCYHSSGYSCCYGYSRFNLATPNTSLNPCRRASGSLRNSWDRVSLGFAGYLRLLPCLASSGYWFGLIKGLMPFTLRLMPFALLFTLSCLAREPNQDTPIKSS